MAFSRQPRDRGDFYIALMCALPLEADAVRGVFDDSWKSCYGKAAGDSNTYTFGRIGEHNVVLAHLPSMGKIASASVAAGIRSSFEKIRLCLLVGICGGVPTGSKDGKEIILGDVVVGTGIVPLDFGRQYLGEVVRKDAVEDVPGRHSLEIRGFVQMMTGQYSRKQLKNDTFLHLTELCGGDDISAWGYPGASKDILYPSTYHHKHQQPEKCEVCAKNGSCQTARTSSCEELGCHASKQAIRRRLQKIKEQALATETHIQVPEIHFGKIGSGDLVMKSEFHRDDYAKRYDVIAFEMEGAGVWDHFPTVIIKGVCDYADSHKNKTWQKYAAATAAACMKAFLQEWRGIDKPFQPSASLGRSSSLSFIGTDFLQGTLQIARLLTVLKGAIDLTALSPLRMTRSRP